MVSLRKLEIRGFKSLGNRPVTINFDKGLTAVTGPNGSGKSNVIDAMLFCLGENSPRALRVNKLTSLIYDGGADVHRPLSTRVTLTFDNLDRAIPVDADPVTVTRELRQTGENVYYLNGKRTQKGTISELLEVALISPSGLNVVPQGMVTHLSELLPEEKRRLIEEIVGVAQFEEKKSEAMRQLRDADVKLQVAMARIGEIKNRVEALEGERNDQLRLKQLEDEIQWLKAVLASKNVQATRKRIADVEKNRQELERTSSELQAKLSEQKDLIFALERERGSFITTVVDGAGGRHVELQFAIAKVTAEIDGLKRELSEARSLIGQLSEAIPDLARARDDQAREVATAKAKIAELSSKLRDLEKARREAEREVQRIHARRKRREANLQRASLLEAALHGRIQASREKLAQTTLKLETLSSRESLTRERLVLLTGKAESFANTLEQLEMNVKELEKLRSIETESLAQLNTNVDDLGKRRRMLEEQVVKGLETLGKAEREVLRYESQKTVVEEYVGEDIALRRLEELAETGAIEGFLGHAGRLLRFDPTYEKAVLAAGQRWLKAAVVKDLRSMLGLIEVAKRLKIGKLRIIPLAEVSESRRAPPPRVDGSLGSLAEFIAADEQLTGLVNFIFGDTVLAASARASYMVASQGFRAVTLSGDLFEAGSSAFETGYVTTLGSLLELLRDETAFTSVKDVLHSLERIITKRKSDLAHLERQTKQVDGERVKRTVLIERLKTELDSASKLIHLYAKIRSSLQKRIEGVKKGHQTLLSSIEQTKSLRTALDAKITKAEERIATLGTRAQIEEIQALDQRREVLKNLVENLAGQISETVTQLSREKANLEHFLIPNLQRTAEQLNNSQTQLAEKTNFEQEATPRLQDLESRLTSLKTEEREFLESSKKSRPILESFESKLQKMREQEDSFKRTLSATEKEIVSATKTLENLREAEQRLLGEITLYGFHEPVDVFDGAEHILEQMLVEFEGLRNSVNLLADRSYRDVFEGYKNLSIRRNQLEVERDAIVRFIEGVEAEKRRVFLSAFEKIDRELRAIFGRLTGGAAWLEIENPDNVFASGVFLMTQFPGKIPRESSSVSGGEKTVSALSLILAIQAVYPSPFYLFDEIDAHLDPLNSEKLAELLRERGNHSQILVVTLKDTVVSRASIVHGFYMSEGVSFLVRYKPGLEVAVPTV